MIHPSVKKNQLHQIKLHLVALVVEIQKTKQDLETTPAVETLARKSLVGDLPDALAAEDLEANSQEAALSLAIAEVRVAKYARDLEVGDQTDAQAAKREMERKLEVALRPVPKAALTLGAEISAREEMEPEEINVQGATSMKVVDLEVAPRPVLAVDRTSAEDGEAEGLTSALEGAEETMVELLMVAPDPAQVERFAEGEMAEERLDALAAEGSEANFQMVVPNLAAVPVARIFAEDGASGDLIDALAAEDMVGPFQVAAPSLAKAVAVASAEKCAVVDPTGAPTDASE